MFAMTFHAKQKTKFLSKPLQLMLFQKWPIFSAFYVNFTLLLCQDSFRLTYDNCLYLFTHRLDHIVAGLSIIHNICKIAPYIFYHRRLDHGLSVQNAQHKHILKIKRFHDKQISAAEKCIEYTQVRFLISGYFSPIFLSCQHKEHHLQRGRPQGFTQRHTCFCFWFVSFHSDTSGELYFLTPGWH